MAGRRDLKDNVSFAGDKLRLQPDQIKAFFNETCNKITTHLKEILQQSNVQGTETILMVGGFSESRMLQAAVKEAFPAMRFLIPADAGLAVLKGAVIFGHNPTAIASRVSRFTYGIRVNKTFDSRKHQQSKKVIIDGEERVTDIFDKHVEVGEEVQVGKTSEEKSYIPSSRSQTSVTVRIYTSDKPKPYYVDERGCEKLGDIFVDMSDIHSYRDRSFLVKMIYGNTELGVEAKVEKTGEVVNASFDFL